MSNASSRELVPGTIGKPNIITRGLMVTRPSPEAAVSRPDPRRWLAAYGRYLGRPDEWRGRGAASRPSADRRGPPSVLRGDLRRQRPDLRHLPPATNNFTIDPEFIQTLHRRNDPLFVRTRLPELEDRSAKLLRDRALILENLDGLDQPGGIPRCARTTSALRRLDRRGAGAARARPRRDRLVRRRRRPATARIRELPRRRHDPALHEDAGARAGDRLPAADRRGRLDAVEAFMLSLGRQDETRLGRS